jgi:membrane fusion protein (multidrug efflux system)
MQLKILVLTSAVAAGAAGIWGYQAYGIRHPSTDDAYLNANVVRVAPRVTGRLTKVLVTDQQHVARKDLLFTIDPEPFRFAVEEGQARLGQARRQVMQLEAGVRSAEAEVHHRDVLLANARSKSERAQRLIKKDYLAQQSLEDAEADYQSAQANLQVAQAGLEEARRALGAAGEANDRVVEAKAALDRARWELDNTRVEAPCSGQIGELSLRPGSVVRADSDLFVLVCTDRYWVEANYKETQLERIAPGQPAQVRVDMYPDHAFEGRVESIGAAAGAAFSLLPPQNASGNWVKVTQRVPVRVVIEDPDPRLPLRVGTSAVVTIDTTAQPMPTAATTGS